MRGKGQNKHASKPKTNTCELIEGDQPETAYLCHVLSSFDWEGKTKHKTEQRKETAQEEKSEKRKTNRTARKEIAKACVFLCMV